VNAVAKSFWRGTANGTTTLLVESSFNLPVLTEEYGAPAAIWTRIDIPSADTISSAKPSTGHISTGRIIGVTIFLVNKTATRHAEAIFLRANPPNVHFHGEPVFLTDQVSEPAVPDPLLGIIDRRILEIRAPEKVHNELKLLRHSISRNIALDPWRIVQL
jgi:hypothetical protein